MLAGLALPLALVGCSGTGRTGQDTTGGKTATGAVHGTIVQIGGPPGAEPGHPAGTVVVTRSGWQVATQQITAGGEFRFTLAPGLYRLTVQDVDGGCAPANAAVTTGSDQAIELTCQRK